MSQITDFTGSYLGRCRPPDRRTALPEGDFFCPNFERTHYQFFRHVDKRSDGGGRDDRPIAARRGKKRFRSAPRGDGETQGRTPARSIAWRRVLYRSGAPTGSYTIAYQFVGEASPTLRPKARPPTLSCGLRSTFARAVDSTLLVPVKAKRRPFEPVIAKDSSFAPAYA